MVAVALLAGCGESTNPPATPDAGAGSAGSDAPSAMQASVGGTISRTAQPMGDAKGPIYIAIFDKDPVIDRDTAQVVARSLIADADLSASTATVTYQVTDVPVRAEKYYFVAFLDDNASVDPADPTSAGPDRGDLVSLDGLASPRIEITTATVHTHDVVLNTMLPF